LQLRAPKEFHERTLWPEFLALCEELHAHLDELTCPRPPTTGTSEPASSAGVRQSATRTSVADGLPRRRGARSARGGGDGRSTASHSVSPARKSRAPSFSRRISQRRSDGCVAGAGDGPHTKLSDPED
jgi:hypothetical protein